MALACVAPLGCFAPDDPTLASDTEATSAESVGSTTGAPTASEGSESGMLSTTGADGSSGDPETSTSNPATTGGCQAGVFGISSFGAACFS